MTVPIIGGEAGFLRHDLPPETLYCPECDRTFVAPTGDQVQRLFHEHLTEVRDPEAHLPCPF